MLPLAQPPATAAPEPTWPEEKMEHEARQTQPLDDTPATPVSWRPELLDGKDSIALAADFDLGEIWRWFHARLEWLGGLTPDQAHLTVLLHWQEKSIMTAIQAARLEANRSAEEQGDRQAYLEYLAADFLTQLALDLDPLPDLEPHPA